MFPYSRAVANATVVLNAGSRTGGRDTFLCLSKEKYRKETTPQCRVYPCASALNGVFRKGLPALTENAIRPCIAPSGRTVQNLRCSARHKGDKTQPSVSVESRSRHRRHRDGVAPFFRPRASPKARRAGYRRNRRVAFYLDTFFWRCKRKYLVFGCENPIKSCVTRATQQNKSTCLT